jgi:polyisoprenoid-binding protein YceI
MASTANTTYQAGTWNIDPAHSTASFSARHMMITKVRGTFKQTSGTIQIAEDPTQSSVRATIQAGSIETREPQRDAHLKSPDFLDAEQFPTLEFVSTAVRPVGGIYEVDGELTIHGITRPATLEVEPTGVGKDPWGATRAGFEATTRINRRDFGMTFNQTLESGGVLVSDRVDITLEVEAVLAS